jgi:hypothetical protein
VALPGLFTISDFGLRRQEAVTGTADLRHRRSKTPMQTFLDALPMTKEKMIAA